MKRFLPFLTSFGLMVLALVLFSEESLVQALNLGTNYPGVTDGVLSTDTNLSGSERVVKTAQNLVSTVKQLLAPVLVFLIAGFGIRMIIAGGNEENFTAATKHFLYLLIGTAFVIFADFLSSTFSLYNVSSEGGAATGFISNRGELLTTANRLQTQILLVVRFARYVLGGIAIFYMVKSGTAILLNPDDETATKQKETFLYGFVGLIIIMISESLVQVFFGYSVSETVGGQLAGITTASSVDTEGGIGLLTNMTNLLLAMMSGLFLFTLIAGGVMYSLSAGNEERGQQANKMIIGSLMGLVIAFSSYTLVAEFSRGGRAVSEVTVPKDATSIPLSPPPAPRTTPTTSTTPTTP